MLQQELLKYVVDFLNANHVDYMVTGSVVSSFQGTPRLTHDADLVVHVPESLIPILLKEFTLPEYYLTESSIRDAIQRQSMFNLLESRSGDKIDFWILTDEPFDKSRFSRKIEEELFGIKMKVSRPQDTILACRRK